MSTLPMFEGAGAGSFALDRLVFGVEKARTRSAANEDPIEARAIAAVKAGDAAAYDYLVSKYMKRVVSIAWGVVRNAADAEDLAQEAFVKAFENIGRFKTGEPFGPWIYRIVTNLGLDVMKHRKRFRHEEITDAAPAERARPRRPAGDLERAGGTDRSRHRIASGNATDRGAPLPRRRVRPRRDREDDRTSAKARCARICRSPEAN